MANVLIKNCKLPSVTEVRAAGKTLTPVTYAKTKVLYEHRDEVWAHQATATTAFMDALEAVEKEQALAHRAEAQAKATPAPK